MAPRPICLLLTLAALAAGCGKKGAPLAPLYLVPSTISDFSAARADDRIRLRFVLPTQNANGPGIDLDRVEIYGITVAAGGETPPNRELLTDPYLVGEISVRPAPVEGGPATPPADDKRPAPGEAVTFVEALTPQLLQAAPRKIAPPPAPSAAGPGRGGAPQTAAPPMTDGIKLAQPSRIYVVRGVARNGRSGPPSGRVQVPLGALPEPPGGVSVRNTEKAVVLEWLPAVGSFGAPAPAYNVYRADALEAPLNPKPLPAPSFEQGGAPSGHELCFRVRSVHAAGPVSTESALSDPVCVTPADVFPPAPPTGLGMVTTEGAVQLIWNANTEADLAGYLVLRAEAPDETLQPLTPAPIRDTVYRDANVKPGVRYLYAIVAVDAATPPNKSAPSERVEALAR